MKERFVEVAADADQKQDQRFEAWLAGTGVPFTDDGAAAAYRERVSLIKDAIQFKAREF